MYKKSKILILIFAVIFTVAVSLSFCFQGVEAEHACVGDDCIICAVLDACRDFIGKSGGANKTAGASVAARFTIILATAIVYFIAVKKSLVTLKVKLSD